MTPWDLKMRRWQKKVYVIDITLKFLMYEFGKPRPNRYPEICSQAQMLKTVTHGDLENEVSTPNIW